MNEEPNNLTWSTLYCRVAYAIASQQIQRGELGYALCTIQNLILPYFPNELHVLSAILRIYLQIGNVDAANILMLDIEKKSQELATKWNVDSVDKLAETEDSLSAEALDLINLVYCDRYLLQSSL